MTKHLKQKKIYMNIKHHYIRYQDTEYIIRKQKHMITIIKEFLRH